MNTDGRTEICPRCDQPMEAGDHKLLESCVKSLKGALKAEKIVNKELEGQLVDVPNAWRASRDRALSQADEVRRISGQLEYALRWLLDYCDLGHCNPADAQISHGRAILAKAEKARVAALLSL